MKNKIKMILNFLWGRNINNSPRIIYYHSIHPSNPLSHSLESFEEQLCWLKNNGYICPKISEIKDYLNSEKVVFITFDDGYYDNRLYALPLLKKYNFNATFFISTGYINEGFRFKSDEGNMLYEGLEMMNKTDLQVLANSGMDIGCHGVSHQMISKLSLELQEKELIESKRFLEEVLDIEIISFAYPNGQKGAISSHLNVFAFNNGIKYVCTTLWGTKNNDESILSRCEMSNEDNLTEFICKIRGKRDYRFFIDRIIDKSKVW